MIIDNAQLLTGIRRILYFGSFLFIASLDTDALHPMIIAMIGFALIRRSGEAWQPTTYLLILFLALLATIKFTDLILGSFTVLIVCVQELWRGRWHIVLRLAACFLAGFLVLWMACGQNLVQSPYLPSTTPGTSARATNRRWGSPHLDNHSGWAVSVLVCALGLRIALSYTYILATPAPCLAFVLLSAFIFLIWKHGFVRSDGHMFMFFVSALLPVVAFPALLDDSLRRRWPSQLLLALAGLLCVSGVRSTSIHIRMARPYLACTRPISGEPLAPL